MATYLGGQLALSLPLRSNFFKGYDSSKYDPRFAITVDVGKAGDLDPAKMKQVTVHVTWLDKVTQQPSKAAVQLITFYSPANL